MQQKNILYIYTVSCTNAEYIVYCECEYAHVF